MLRPAFWLALLVALAGFWPAAHATDAIRVADVRLERSASAEDWLLWARFEVPLAPPMEQALRDGVTLHYVAEFDLTRARWYWWNERAVRARQPIRLSYHLLTHQYRVDLSGHIRHYPTLAQAVAALSHLRGWPVATVDALEPGTRYDAQIRLRFDQQRLPRTYQVGALTNNDWDIRSEWKRFTLTTATPTNDR